MSDFIFFSEPINKAELTSCIQSIYHGEIPRVYEFNGDWGTLAVSASLYKGFQPLENEKHIFVIIGAPVLYFSDNDFLTKEDSKEGTDRIYKKYMSGKINWIEDLSGPFCALLINKREKEIICITDMLMIIPVYIYEQDNIIALSTHVDMLARATGQANDFDNTSIIDFLLNGRVTYPYTAYRNIKQLQAASIHKYKITESNHIKKEVYNYWIPKERSSFKDIKKISGLLRDALQYYIERVTVNMKNVAQFISGGEDSRVIAGILPKRLCRDAFIFLDSMNREGKIARKAARSQGMSFYVGIRNITYYIDILSEASDLVGFGYQYQHAHSLGFYKLFEFKKYDAIFGGLFANSILKGLWVKKPLFNKKFPFTPEIYLDKLNKPDIIKASYLPKYVLAELNERIISRYHQIKQLRKDSAYEWLSLWPATMYPDIPNFFVSRRLFRSYEPFMNNQVIKISSEIPLNYKLNRRVFYHMAKPILKETKYLMHSDGWVPYFPWYLDMFIYGSTWFARKIIAIVGIYKGNQGPWFDWSAIVHSKKWHDLIKYYSSCNVDILNELIRLPVSRLFKEGYLNEQQKRNLLQILYTINKNLSKKIS